MTGNFNNQEFNIKTIFTFDSSRVQVDIHPIGTNQGIDINVEKKVRMFSLLFMSNPTEEFAKSYQFVDLGSDILTYSLQILSPSYLPLMELKAQCTISFRIIRSIL